MPLFIYKIRLNPKPSRLILKVALYCHGAPMFNLNVVLSADVKLVDGYVYHIFCSFLLNCYALPDTVNV